MKIIGSFVSDGVPVTSIKKQAIKRDVARGGTRTPLWKEMEGNQSLKIYEGYNCNDI